MNTSNETEFVHQIYEVYKRVHEVLSETDPDVATNAMMVVLAQYGKLSSMTTEEFLALILVQVKHLMNNIIVSEYPIQ